ncbi:tyrosine-protein phosphatase [Streptomyces tubbatahanensis]|uniref:Tyrosine-protein phosphatase n=1 Tax=Streptomyces tubbatahanensis TaxID=2923272 RepID=A0ABY3XWN5_9ACTN|nr:tyrosine-protein phosphatase [Streptomyces tubbatahanensis]UNS98924.1 tyrosine-protein phosphatase [Streptomyces tubbatahanensis]
MRLMMRAPRAPRGRKRARVGAAVGVVVLVAAGCGDGSRQGRAEAAPGVIPFTSAVVTDHADGTSTVRWSAPGAGSVTVYAEGEGEDEGKGAGEGREEGDGGGRVAVGEARDAVTLRAGEQDGRRWFRLVPDRGRSLRLADRSLGLDSVPNFRDAGGYRTADGRWVAMGKLYRSASLDRLSAADRRTLRRLGIDPVLDLRTAGEARKQPDALGEGERPRRLDVLGGGESLANTQPTSADHARTLLRDSYADFVAAKTGRAAYRALFAEAADPDGEAVLYHCTAGKDRTGWASAALLTALGVPRSTVVRDYLASNRYLTAYNRQARAQLPDAVEDAYEPLLGVRKTYLDASFARVDHDYGTFDHYLAAGLRLADDDLAALRDELLVGEPES